MRNPIAALAAASVLLTAAPPAFAQSTAYTWANYAGLDGSIGYVDVPGAAARFLSYQPPAVDAAGNLFVGDGTRIRKITPAGVVSTLAGSAISGFEDGTGAAAKLQYVSTLAVDSTGDIYFYDNARIRKVTQAGVVTTLAGGNSVGIVDGTGTAAGIPILYGMAVDPATNDVYFAADRMLRKMTAAGVVTTVAGGTRGYQEGTGAAARFNRALGLTVDAGGNVYVADQSNHAIRKVTPDGVVTTEIGGHGQGNLDGPGATAQFSFPRAVVCNPLGTFSIVESGNGVRQVAPDGTVTTVLSGLGLASLALDPAGNLYGTNTDSFLKVDPAFVVTNVAGQGPRRGDTDGPVAVARFSTPQGVALDSAGNVYVVHQSNGEGFPAGLRKITPDGNVTTVGSGERRADAIAIDRFDNIYIASVGIYKITPAVGKSTLSLDFNEPVGLATDRPGNVYVAAKGSHTIGKITPAGVVTTLAGNGTSGTADGTGAGATFAAPLCVAVDAAGTVYVGNADRIRKITSAGVVTTLTTATGAKGLAVDSSGSLYAATGDTVRKITAAGVITTIGGTAGVATSLDGVGPEALFNSAVAIAIDANRTLYVADSVESRIARGLTDYVPSGPDPTPTPVAPTIATKGSTKLETSSGSVKIKGTANSSVVRIEYKVGKNGKIRSKAVGASWTIRVTGLEEGKNAVYVRGVTVTGVRTAFKKYKVTRE